MEGQSFTRRKVEGKLHRTVSPTTTTPRGHAKSYWILSRDPLPANIIRDQRSFHSHCKPPMPSFLLLGPRSANLAEPGARWQEIHQLHGMSGKEHRKSLGSSCYRCRGLELTRSLSCKGTQAIT